jgi:hypothetical protein
VRTQIAEVDPVILLFLEHELVLRDLDVLNNFARSAPLRTAPNFERPPAVEESFATRPVTDKNPQHRLTFRM